MEENKVVEIEETTTEVVKESKAKKFVGAIGSGIKNNWKTFAVGAIALAAGVAIGSKKSFADDDVIEEVADSVEDTAETL